MERSDLYLSETAEIIKAFYADAALIGTTDALIKAIEKAYNAGKAAKQ